MTFSIMTKQNSKIILPSIAVWYNMLNVITQQNDTQHNDTHVMTRGIMTVSSTRRVVMLNVIDTVS
jgi:hypothetical protein